MDVPMFHVFKRMKRAARMHTQLQYAICWFFMCCEQTRKMIRFASTIFFHFCFFFLHLLNANQVKTCTTAKFTAKLRSTSMHSLKDQVRWDYYHKWRSLATDLIANLRYALRLRLRKEKVFEKKNTQKPF